MSNAAERNLIKIYEVNNCLIDVRLKEVAYDARVCRPDIEVFETLVYLIENRDHVVDLDEFRDSLWLDTEVSEFEIVRNIMKARRLINDDDSKRLIEYVSDTPGYRFVGDVLELEID